MAEDKEKKEKVEEKKEEAPGFIEIALATLLGIVVIIAVIGSLIVGAFKSQVVAETLNRIGTFLQGAKSTSLRVMGEFLSWLSQLWATVDPKIRTAGHYLASFIRFGGAIYVICMVLCILVGLIAGKTVMTGVGFLMLALIALAITATMQWFIRWAASEEDERRGRGLTTFSVSRVPAIIYLSIVQIGAFFIYWGKIHPLLPSEVSTSYTVLAIVFAVFGMSSFSVLLARRRNVLFQVWVWVTCILLVIAIFLQFPMISKEVEHTIDKVTVLNTQVCPVQTGDELVLWSKPEKPDGNWLGSVTIVEEGDLVTYNRQDFVKREGYPYLFYSAVLIRDGKEEKSGYIAIPEKVSIEAPTTEVDRSTVDKTGTATEEEAADKTAPKPKEVEPEIETGKESFFGVLTTEWKDTGIILRRNDRVSDLVYWKSAEGSLTEEDVARMEFVQARPEAGPDLVGPESHGKPGINGHGDNAYGLSTVYDANPTNCHLYVRVEYGADVAVNLTVTRGGHLLDRQ